MAEVDLPSGASPVEDAIQVQFLDPLAEATTVAFREVAATDVFLDTVCHTARPIHFGERSAMIELSFPSGTGVLVLSTTATAAATLAGRVLAGQDLDVDAFLIDDCLGEIANVIAGQGKAMLAETDRHYVFGTPRVASGLACGVFLGGRSGWFVLSFQCDLGLIFLQVSEVTPAK